MICQAIIYPPNHDFITSTAESIPNIPAPIAAPLAILVSNDGCLATDSRRQIILSNRSKRALLSIPIILLPRHTYKGVLRPTDNKVCHLI